MADTTSTQGEAVVYLRSASGGSSVSGQEARCRATAKEHNLRVRAVYRDLGVSDRIVERPGLGCMLRDIAASPVMHVIVADPARIARSLTAEATIRRQIAATGATVLDGVDPATPAGRFMQGIQAAITSYDTELRSERAKLAARRRTLRKEAHHAGR